ncbi:MAG: hypothetical protein CMK43_10310 [Porticoccaceae bacterium]|nr:hypothetical protein [Porticoccaceae bacterium]
MQSTDKRASPSIIILGLGAIAALLIVGGLIYRLQMTKEVDIEAEVLPSPITEEVIIEKPVIPEAEIPIAPVIEVSPEPPKIEPAPKTVLPNLNESDSFFRNRMEIMSSNTDLVRWLSVDDLLRRTASYLDGLSRGVILSKIFPLTQPNGSFTTHMDGETIWLNAGNYERYDITIEALASINMEALAQLFHIARPLIETSFAEMGYNERQMEGIILQAIDRVLSTPIIIEPIELTRESVLYQFADPELEALMPLQKQVLRTGPENTQKLQQQALALKNALLNP